MSEQTPHSQEPTDSQPSSEDDEYKVAAKEASEYVQPTPPKSATKPITKRMVVVFFLIILIAGAGSYWFFIRSKHVTTNSGQAQQKIPSQIDTKTKQYTSNNFNLTFSYPADWTITDNGNGQMTVRSPGLQLKNTGGQEITGQVVISIRDASQVLSEFNKGSAIAVLDSQKITYTNPTQTQRASTYISFLNYANSSQTGLDGIYITGDNGYQKGQNIPQGDIGKEDPVIDINFVKCTSSQCSGNGTPLTISSSSWKDNTFAQPLTTMLESFSIT